MEPLVLLLHPSELQVIKDALTEHANTIDREGDILCESEIMDRLWERLDALDGIANAMATELCKSIGIGRYKGRPQG
jgi:hypothetical protein